ncbi:MAG: glutamate-5-semialdehyde dehydrogenase [Dehalococcoidaceae bacterium]|nr:glutamate-5-semialdehyde dehydrogenase [Dehalococcoidaceae bacterium]|tara:strand:+ start:30303 stop:31580 length:1278 start_codon:yes stop_codon:yes gene_type:complete
MSSKVNEVLIKAKAAKAASSILSNLSTKEKNKAISIASKNINKYADKIIQINKQDIKKAKKNNINDSFIDRMFLDKRRIGQISKSLIDVVQLDDPIGIMEDVKIRPNGMQVGKRRVPLGVIGAIFESRPNVAVEIASLCLKSGNAVVMRSGSDAHASAQILTEIFIDSVQKAGVPEECIGFIDTKERQAVNEMLKLSDYIDLVIPRGGSGLINLVKSKSRIPVVAGGIGVCHTYVDQDVDIELAKNIVVNAKTRRPSVCNTLDTVLIHSKVANDFLNLLKNEFQKFQVTMHVDKKVEKILNLDKKDNLIIPVKNSDYNKEWLSLDCSVKIVDSIEEAIEHINSIGSAHSESIATSSYIAAQKFQNEVDASSIFVNVSTGFADGGEYGLGNEFGISTQKLHARGPMGLKELTSYKWIILGNGQVRD